LVHAHLFVKIPKPGDSELSEVILSIFESSCHLLLVTICLTIQR